MQENEFSEDDVLAKIGTSDKEGETAIVENVEVEVKSEKVKKPSTETSRRKDTKLSEMPVKKKPEIQDFDNMDEDSYIKDTMPPVREEEFVEVEVKDDGYDNHESKINPKTKKYLFISVAVLTLGAFSVGLFFFVVQEMSENKDAVKQEQIITESKGVIEINPKIEKIQEQNDESKAEPYSNLNKATYVDDTQDTQKDVQVVEVMDENVEKEYQPYNSSAVLSGEIKKEDLDVYSDDSEEVKETSKGYVCTLKEEHESGKEYVYYILDGIGYIPAFEMPYWNKEGVVLNVKNIALSLKKVEQFAEIKKNKFLPLEMFSSCTKI